MAQVIRLIVYDSEDDSHMNEQLSQSLPEAIHNFENMKITIMDIANISALNDAIKQLDIK